jgi:hypothetical protein
LLPQAGQVLGQGAEAGNLFPQNEQCEFFSGMVPPSSSGILDEEYKSYEMTAALIHCAFYIPTLAIGAIGRYRKTSV